MKHLTAIVILLFCSVITFAQEKKTEQTSDRNLMIVLQVKDHLTHDGIDSTLTAQLLNAKDSTFIDTMKVEGFSYDNKRNSYVTHKIFNPGTFLIKLEAKGYQTKYVNLDIEKLYKREKYMELKTAYLHKEKKKLEMELDELVVTATKLKFYMDGDTLVYNADAFNLAEGSMIDALIRKLPGVELKKNGEILVNGQKVEALLLNGKDFFDSDRELMLENMPAYMVKNIQSYERVPERVKGTINEKTAKKELVMNVRLKREYNKGWVFTAEGGIGSSFKRNENGHHDTKFMGRLFALRFSDHSRFMLFGNANNLNDDRTPGEQGEWSPLTQSQGLTETYKIGTDYAIGSWETTRYHTSANLTYKETDDSQHSDSESFLEGGNTYGRSFSNTRNYNVSFNTSHDFTLRANQPKKWYKMLFIFERPSFSYMKWNNHSNSASTTLSEDVAENLGKSWMDSIAAPNAGELLKKYAITRSINSTKGSGHWTQFTNNAQFVFAPAHNDLLNFNMAFSIDFNERSQDTYDHNLVDYPSNASAAEDFRNRYNPTYDKNLSISLVPDLALALNTNEKAMHVLELEHNYQYKNNVSNQSIYLLNKLSEWGKVTEHPVGTLPSMEETLSTLDTYNSSRSRATTVENSPELSYSFRTSNDDMYSMFKLALSMPTKHETLNYWKGTQCDTLISRNTTFLAPSFNYYYYNMKKRRNISFSYTMNSSAPSMTTLLNIRDTSNPLYISQGNPNLENTRTHNISASYSDKYGRGTLFNINAGASITQNAIASSRIYDRTTGVTTATPDNVNGNWTFNSNVGVDVPLDKGEKWRVKENLSYNYNHSVDLNGETALLEGKSTRSVVRSNYLNESLSLTFRPSSKMEFTAKGDMNYQHSTSERQNFTTINAYDFNYGFGAQIELPWKMQFSTDLTMYSRRGYSDSSMNTNELVWNARLTKRMLKGSLLLHLDAFDLLNNLSNVRRSINAQGKTETFYNVIPSYCLVHLAWKFNKNPKKQ